MTELAKQAIEKNKDAKCMNSCGQKATTVCCWKNIDPREKAIREKELGYEIPYDYHPFCDTCAADLFERVKYQEFFITHPIT